MSVPRRSFLWKAVQSWWILLLFTVIGNGVAFLYIGLRTRTWRWVGWSVVYSYPLFLVIFEPDSPGSTMFSVLSAIMFVVFIASLIHGIAVCGQYLRRLEERQAAAWEAYLRSTGRIAPPGGRDPVYAAPGPQAARTTDPFRRAPVFTPAQPYGQSAPGIGQAPVFGHSPAAGQPYAAGQAPMAEQSPAIGQWPPSGDEPEFGQAPAAGPSNAGGPVPNISAPPTPQVYEAKPVNVNSASESELAELPGIGAVLAKKAVQYREAARGFRSVDEFFEVLGLKPHAVVRLRPLLTCGPVSDAPSSHPSPPGGGRVVDY